MEWPEDFPDDHVFLDLLPCVSSERDYDQFLQDMEEKLRLNANSIQQQLRQIQTEMGDSGTTERPTSPSQCLQWLDLRMRSGVKNTTGNQDLMDFFKALRQFLRSDEDEKEEATLQLLLDLSDQSGVWFPRPPSSSSSSSSPHHHHQLTSPSVHLLHSVSDDSAIQVQEVWDDVRLQLRCHLLDRLSCRRSDRDGRDGDDGGDGHICLLSVPDRVLCLQRLLFLFPQSDVLTHYQTLRIQSVQLILNSSLSSSPGQTGFDRLALGFRSALPALTRALKEELQVLWGITEPRVALAWLNRTYFNTVARELSAMLERERELALRDNTAIGSKTKKYSGRSRATVAPLELPVKSRSFSLTSHQLRALTQLCDALLKFESDVKELIANMTFIDRTGHSASLKGFLKKGREDPDEGADIKKSSTEPDPHTSEALQLDWISALDPLVPHMQHCVKVVLDDVCVKSLQREADLYSTGLTELTLSRCCRDTHLQQDPVCTCSERDTPKMMAEFCRAILSELDSLLPLAAACGRGALLEVRSSFLEACGRAAFAVLGRVQERALAVPSAAPLKNLPTLLSTCICVHQRLRRYHARLSYANTANTAAAKSPLTLLPIQKYQEAVEALQDQLTSYCVQVCSTCLFQDPESHHWADPKPFYEGERCSFSLQMWFYFLCGLRSDLWAVLPADVAKDVLGRVLSETLQLLVLRYARVRPSYGRRLQIRADITAVLLYSEHLLWSLCDRPEALVRSGPSAVADIVSGCSDWPYHIHSLCEQLLTVLVVATAPLESLHRTFVVDLVKNREAPPTDSSALRWLNAIDAIDEEENEDIQDGLLLQGPSALVCQLRLLTSDPGCNPPLLLRALLHGDCHLPRILLENSHLCQDGNAEVSTESCRAGEDFLVALFELFCGLENVPRALTLVLEPYMKREQCWEHLYTLADLSETAPPIMSRIQALVTKSTDSLLTHLVSRATEEVGGASIRPNVPGSVLAKIPKEWNYTPTESQGEEAGLKTSLASIVQAVSFVLANLPSAVTSVPLSVRYLFQEAEKKHLSQHALQRPGLLLWVLLGCLLQGLERIGGLEPDSGARDWLSLLAQCVRAAVGLQHQVVPKPSVLKVLQALEVNRPDWTDLQLQKARELCSDSVPERDRESGGGGSIAVAAAAEATEQKMALMLLDLSHRTGGSCCYLRLIYHIIQRNEELLLSKLRGRSDSTSDLVNFCVDPEDPTPATRFDPLRQFDRVGDRKLDQSAVLERVWDWTGLLPKYWTMSRVTFTRLLANRWEMLDGAELEDGEREMVEELRRDYLTSCCCCDGGGDGGAPGEEDPPEAAQHRTPGDSDATSGSGP